VAVRAALQEQGFGILAEIDLKATLKSKLDVDIASQAILGALSSGAGLRGPDRRAGDRRGAAAAAALTGRPGRLRDRRLGAAALPDRRCGAGRRRREEDGELFLFPD
jgi:hypothetical protein